MTTPNLILALLFVLFFWVLIELLAESLRQAELLRDYNKALQKEIAHTGILDRRAAILAEYHHQTRTQT